MMSYKNSVLAQNMKAQLEQIHTLLREPKKHGMF
jgi:hypothetical protein